MDEQGHMVGADPRPLDDTQARVLGERELRLERRARDMERRLYEEDSCVGLERSGDLGEERGWLCELVDHVEGEDEVDLADEVADAEAVAASQRVSSRRSRPACAARRRRPESIFS
jgi:hypothetical protein